MPPRKCRKLAQQKAEVVLQDLVYSNGLTMQGLKRVVEKLKATDGLDDVEGISIKHSIERAASSIMQRISVTDTFEYASDGGKCAFALVSADPNALLVIMVEEAPCVAELYENACREHPPSQERPWSLVVCWDEFTGGNILRVHPNRKKVMSIYFSFLELGNAALTTVYGWHGPLHIRSHELKRIQGGFSAVLRRYLRRQLLGDGSSHGGLATSGVPLTLAGRIVAIFARLAVMSSDGEGHALSCDWRGASGFKPCLHCDNVLKRDSGIAPGEFVEVTCTDVTRFRKRSRGGLLAEHRLLSDAHRARSAGRIRQAEYDRIEKAMSFNFNPHGFLADSELMQYIDFPEIVNLDWCHTILQDGVLAMNCTEFFAASDKWQAFCTYINEGWRWSGALERKVTYIFDSVFKEAGTAKLKCSCSELLSFYAILRHFVETECNDPALEPQRQALISVCEMVDVIQAIKKQKLSCDEGVESLKRLEGETLKLFIKAYPDARLKPKCHWLLHMASQIALFRAVVDQFVVERLHHAAKAASQKLPPQPRFETTLLNATLTRSLTSLKAMPSIRATSLCGKTAHWPNKPGTLLARRLQFEGCEFCVGDVVFSRDRSFCGEIAACCCSDGDKFFIVIELWEFTRHASMHSAVYRPSAILRGVGVADIELAAAWIFLGGHAKVVW